MYQWNGTLLYFLVINGLQKFTFIAKYHGFIRFNPFLPFISIQDVDLGNKWQHPMHSHLPGLKMGLNSMLPVARWTDSMFLCTALLSSFSHAGPRTLSPVVTRRARIVPCTATLTAYILCLGQTSPSEAESSLTVILLVRLAIARRHWGWHGPSATRHRRDSDTGRPDSDTGKRDS